ncbi:single hybrid motif-containing protein [Dichomitus squalens]|uniref:Single hybrid motif-containing protein n=1 Tax=Dichomitus squalens TaxID=114155 RepID=A0A4Q9PG82_9APHY|nr:single hybrid motif-containing protein [Dichomitus squalens LYAD-421 SS1]EJF62657.1 single hybrid motif-containing protein [Dichomitus squalens LYAD-421 SS1]TBU40415.1 single hybrid motif-containing protein [Dichomitus squalens]TBU52237.1 single hybrid motif-containing protein [Dichomitus squalens]
MQSLHHVSKAAIRASTSKRWISTSAVRYAVSKLAMPAMSPTMTEGGIASWKKKEGESFIAGDVLLEIETDKATIDVEAQDDGVLGKILAPDGTKNVPVGKTIALLAEEGDDISNLEVPADEPASSSNPSQPTPEHQAKPAPFAPSDSEYPTSARGEGTHPPESHVPHHSRPLFPSVIRLIQEHGISQGDVNKIKGTGVRGMLTKGDVLTHLGLASGPSGTYRETPPPDLKTNAKKSVKEAAPLDGITVRRLIVGNMLEASTRARAAATPVQSIDFDSIIADYLPPSKPAPPTPTPEAFTKPKSATFLDGLL